MENKIEVFTKAGEPVKIKEKDFDRRIHVKEVPVAEEVEKPKKKAAKKKAKK